MITNHLTVDAISIIYLITLYWKNKHVVDRAIKLAHPLYRPNNLLKVKCAFKTNGFAEGVINRYIKNRVHKAYNQGHVINIDGPESYMSILYADRSSIRFRKILKEHNVDTAFTGKNSNSKNFSKLETKIDLYKSANVVCSVPFGNCNKIYLRQTAEPTQRRHDGKT